MTIEPMTFDEVKNAFLNALDKANTPTEFIQNILTMSSELGYNAGLNDAWETAKKLRHPSFGGFYDSEQKDIFGYENSDDVLTKFTASEAIAKIKEYEEKQKAPSVARACSILEDDCPYIIECEECEVHCSIERAKQKLKEGK